MKKVTQGDRILLWLDQHGSITPADAWNELGITKLATRISELRRDGEKIQKKYITVKNRYGEDVQVMEYRRA